MWVYRYRIQFSDSCISGQQPHTSFYLHIAVIFRFCSFLIHFCLFVCFFFFYINHRDVIFFTNDYTSKLLIFYMELSHKSLYFFLIYYHFISFLSIIYFSNITIFIVVDKFAKKSTYTQWLWSLRLQRYRQRGFPQDFILFFILYIFVTTSLSIFRKD